MDDHGIVDLFWQRSEDALTVCADRYERYCRTIACNILNSDADADECVNDTWLRVWNAIPPAKPLSLKAYLGKITRNLSLDRLEASNAQKRVSVCLALEELADIPVPDSADDEEITNVINVYLHSETRENADIFIKRYWYAYSIKEIAGEYRYGESKIASLLLRMRKRLRTKLESEGLL